MAPNKTLAAQLANELREMLPNNAVEYFVSYYDYYQPEAYVPQTDTYIEKDSAINSEVERLRHSATMSLLTRRDVVVVATVSCIYGLGTPQEYVDRSVRLRVGQQIEREPILRGLVGVQYARNDLAFSRGTFRVRGDTVEVFPVYEELAIRVEMFGEEIERLYYLHPLTGEVVREVDEVFIFPATHYAAGPERMERAIAGIERELAVRLEELTNQNKLLEAQRLKMRTSYDIEMMRQVGLLLRHRELLAAHRRPAAGQRAELPARLLPRGLPAGHRRVARDRAADRRHVRGRHVAQAHPGRPRVPAAERDGQPAVEVRGVRRADRADGVPVRDARQLRAGQDRRRVRRAGHPADRPGRSRGGRQADEGPDRRPGARDPVSGPRRTSGSWSPR